MNKRLLFFNVIVGVVSSAVTAVVMSKRERTRFVEPVTALITDAYVQHLGGPKYFVLYMFAGEQFQVDVEDKKLYMYFKERVGQELLAFAEYKKVRGGKVLLNCHLKGR